MKKQQVLSQLDKLIKIGEKHNLPFNVSHHPTSWGYSVYAETGSTYTDGTRQTPVLNAKGKPKKDNDGNVIYKDIPNKKMFSICVRISDHSKMAGSLSGQEVTHNVALDNDDALVEIDELLKKYASKIK